ncbi:MAG TPA: 4-(cytidine 5'-diphospho)-2-C-methyl-D-erythritol kinase [Acidimicrobiales bacterium]|nr:4-(cytidine 5'-diphospho)-2-C-methyl-D-erythritol kinase [Acidimicrobiales bacterium]
MTAAATGAVHVKARAKLTRRLRVTGVRADGMHLIDAEMVSLSLADDLELTPGGEGLQVIDRTPGSSGLAVRAEPTNLVIRALDLVGRRAAVRLTKRIPAGAGLGGGSSDAAAVLRWAGVEPDRAGLARAAALGADVPFCLVGGRARVAGIGEEVEPLAPRALEFTLLLPPFGVSTPAVYRAWDALGGPTGPAGNDLEPAAVAVEPRLAPWRDRLAGAAGAEARLAGSGSTWFVEGSHPGLEGPMADPDGGPPAWVLTARAEY